MEKEFIPYEQALELEELGYSIYHYQEKLESFYSYLDGHLGDPGFDIFNELVLAPIYQQAFRFFRDKYDLHVSFGRLYDNAQTKRYTIDTYNEICSYEVDYSGGYSTYEEAQLACLKKLIEIAKHKIATINKWISDETDKMVLEEMIKIAKNK